MWPLLVPPGHVRDAQVRHWHLAPSSSSRAVRGRCCWGISAGARQPPAPPPPHACHGHAAVALLLPKKFPLGSLGEISAQAQLLPAARPPLSPLPLGLGCRGAAGGFPMGPPPQSIPGPGRPQEAGFGVGIWGQLLVGCRRAAKCRRQRARASGHRKSYWGGGEKRAKGGGGRGRGGKSCGLCLVSSPSAVTQPPNSPSSCHSEAGGDYAEALSRIDSCGTRA